MSTVFNNREPLESGIELGIEWEIYYHSVTGAINGYARIPEGHPWRELEGWQWGNAADVDIHEGITFGMTLDGWIGFDTSHAWDYWENSTFNSFMRDVENRNFWTQELVVLETKSLAKQIATGAYLSV